eukprot:m.136584 g.136584  ORF g.136584 m.136584 type:complete len:126 (-) comp10767_c0_seq1:169-546(-)
MVKKFVVCSVDECVDCVKENKTESNRVFVLCSGAENADGQSWCPDCVVAKPIVEECVNENGDESDVYIYCNVGDRSAWKTPENEFRNHGDFKLTAIPTFFVWGTQMKLVEAQCGTKDNVALVFED